MAVNCARTCWLERIGLNEPPRAPPSPPPVPLYPGIPPSSDPARVDLPDESKIRVDTNPPSECAKLMADKFYGKDAAGEKPPGYYVCKDQMKVDLNWWDRVQFEDGFDKSGCQGTCQQLEEIDVIVEGSSCMWHKDKGNCFRTSNAKYGKISDKCPATCYYAHAETCRDQFGMFNATAPPHGEWVVNASKLPDRFMKWPAIAHCERFIKDFKWFANQTPPGQVDRTSQYVLKPATWGGCVPGTHIETAKDCKDALEALGEPAATDTDKLQEVSRSWIPKYCSRDPRDHQGYFNSGSTGRGNGYQPVCKNPHYVPS
jgi:hypothetical protein